MPNKGNEQRLSDFRIREHADWYLERAESERQQTGSIDEVELGAALRKVLGEDGVLPEFIAVEFERVMCVAFGT